MDTDMDTGIALFEVDIDVRGMVSVLEYIEPDDVADTEHRAGIQDMDDTVYNEYKVDMVGGVYNQYRVNVVVGNRFFLVA